MTHHAKGGMTPLQIAGTLLVRTLAIGAGTFEAADVPKALT